MQATPSASLSQDPHDPGAAGAHTDPLSAGVSLASSSRPLRFDLAGERATPLAMTSFLGSPCFVCCKLDTRLMSNLAP